MIQTFALFTGLGLSLFSPITKPISTTTCTATSETCPQISSYSPEATTASLYGEPLATLYLQSEAEPTKSSTSLATPSPTSPSETKSSPKTYFVPPAAAHTLDSQKLFELINLHRTSINLAPFQSHPDVCDIANQRVPELANEIFGNQPLHAGFRARSFPFWITENLIHQPSEEAALNWWLNSPIHRRAIESTKYQFSCGACSGNNCVQLFTSFDPKQ